MNFKLLARSAALAVNSAIGSLFHYVTEEGEVIKNCHIVIDRSIPVKDSFGIVVGYQVLASIPKEEVEIVHVGDFFKDAENGEEWEVTARVKETNGKWYVDVFQRTVNGYL